MNRLNFITVNWLCILALGTTTACDTEVADEPPAERAGTGGMNAGDQTASGGIVGTGGTLSTGGSATSGGGGNVTTGGTNATGGIVGSGGLATGGIVGTGGTDHSTDAGEIDVDACMGDVQSLESGTSDGCAECLCTGCPDELLAMRDDTAAIDLFLCGKANDCSGDCCFCGAPCDRLLGTNYRLGPCPTEVEVAAGVPSPSNALIHGLTLSASCDTPGNSCNKAIALASCISVNCANACDPVPVCQ